MLDSKELAYQRASSTWILIILKDRKLSGCMENNMKLIKGNTTEEMLEHVDTILRRMQRRLHKTVIGVIPPDLTFNYVGEVSEDGVLLRAIFPSGKLTKGFMFVEEYVGREPVTFVAKVEGVAGSKSKNFVTRLQHVVIDPELETDIGDRLTFSVIERERVKGIWIGFLFQIEMKDSVKETYLLTQLEQLMEGG